MRPTSPTVGGIPVTPNQLTLAQALDRLAADHPDNDLIQRLSQLPASQLIAALDLLSPEDLASIVPLDPLSYMCSWIISRTDCPMSGKA